MVVLWTIYEKLISSFEINYRYKLGLHGEVLANFINRNTQETSFCNSNKY